MVHVYAVQMIVRMCHMGVHVSRFAQADANKSVVFNVGGEREREREGASKRDSVKCIETGIRHSCLLEFCRRRGLQCHFLKTCQ